MKNKGVLYKKSIAAIFIVAMLFSCKGRINQVRQLDVEPLAPQIEEYQARLVYTDSARMTLRLETPKLLDYGNLDFSYSEFPEGAFLSFFDEKDHENTVKADYAIVYNETNLIDMQGNVEINLADGTLLTAEQLYWDRSRQWVFTDRPYTVKMNNGTVNEGDGFDSNEKFDNFISRSNVGIHFVKEEDTRDGQD